MVCRYLDSFDYYASDDLSRKWNRVGVTGFAVVQSVVVRTGGNAFRSNSGFGFLDRTFDDQASWVVGFAYFADEINLSVGQIIVQFLDTGTIQCSLRVNANGKMEVLRGATTAVTDGRATSFPLAYLTWYFIEMKVTIANSIGVNTCQVRVNGVQVINVATGQDLQSTANAIANVFRFNGSASGTSAFIDDIYIFDGTDGGGTEPINDDFIGDVKVAAHFPNGNGTTNNFVGSDADSVDNYLLVDENPTDDDSTYTESSTPGNIDLYTFDDLATTPADIFAVQINNVARKDDVGTRTIRSVIRPTSTNFFGASKSPSAASYFNEIEILNEDPETGLAWTESGFNATEFGVEIET